MSPLHLRIAREVGLEAYRGNQTSWLYAAERTHAASPLARAGRLADCYVSISGPNGLRPHRDASGMVNVPSSRFLRPVSKRLRRLEGLRLKRIQDGMSHAAMTGSLYHVWFHAHNFGRDIDSNLDFVTSVLRHFTRLRDTDGMQSHSMSDIAAGLDRGQASGTDGPVADAPEAMSERAEERHARGTRPC